MRVGSIEIVPISDGSTAVPTSMLFSATEEQWAPHRKFLDAKGRVPMEIGGFLIRGVGDRVALVDLGIGALGRAIGMGSFMESYRCAHDDWAFFVDPGGAPPNPLAEMINAPSEAEHLGPAADRFEVWDEGSLLPGVNVAAAPGHTPGSSVLVFSSGTERALLIGDVAHCPVELLEPEWAALSDVDPELAARTREALAREYEGTDIPMAASHFEGMKFGRLLPAVGKRQWVFG